MRSASVTLLCAAITVTSIAVTSCESITSSIRGPDVSLKVGTDPGVSGTPPVGEQSVTRGRSIPYAFSPTAGYEQISVFLDGEPAPATGTVQMDTSHTLFATARRTRVAPSGEDAAVQRIKDTFSAGDPLTTAVAVANDVVARFQAGDGAKAKAELEAIRYAAVDPLRDREALARSVTSLPPHFFSLAPDGRVSLTPEESGTVLPLRQTRTTQTSAYQSASANRPITILYVNGIRNTVDDVYATWAELQKVVKEAGVPAASDGSSPRVLGFYNQSWWAGTGDPRTVQCAAITPVDLTSAAAVGQYKACGAGMLEVFTQFWGANEFPAAFNSQATLLAHRIYSFLRQGHGVIIVPHSHGNLLTQTALDMLTIGPSAVQFQNPAHGKCIGIVGLAPPKTRQWTTWFHRKFFFVKGKETEDILLTSIYGPLNRRDEAAVDATQLATDKSEAADAELNRMSKAGFLSKQAVFIAGLRLNFELHNALGSYLLGRPIRNEIARALREQASAIRSDCVPVPNFDVYRGTYRAESAGGLPIGVKTPDTGTNSHWYIYEPSTVVIDGDSAVAVTAWHAGQYYYGQSTYGGWVQYTRHYRLHRIFTDVTLGEVDIGAIEYRRRRVMRDASGATKTEETISCTFVEAFKCGFGLLSARPFQFTGGRLTYNEFVLRR